MAEYDGAFISFLNGFPLQDLRLWINQKEKVILRTEQQGCLLDVFPSENALEREIQHLYSFEYAIEDLPK